MSAENSKQVVGRWFDAVNRGDPSGILALLSEDFVFEAMLRQPAWLKYHWNREQFAATPAAMSALMEAPMAMEIVSMIAEDDMVAVEATSDALLKNGRRYDNAYHFVFRVRNDLIAEAREYSCSHLAQYCFSDFNPWAGREFEQDGASAIA